MSVENPSEIPPHGAAPRVSVVMPVHNGERYLREAVESILGQTFRDFEVLAIDDGSTDGTATMLEDFARRDRRVRYIRNPTNLGLVPALNIGLDAARGEFIARMDHDDWSHPERFARQVAFLDANPDFILVGSAIVTIDARGRKRKVDTETTTWPEFEWISLFRNPIVHPTAMFRTSLYRAHGERYDPSFAASEDFELWCRAAKHGKALALREALVHYRLHDTNISVLRSQAQSEGLRRTAGAQFARRCPHLASLKDRHETVLDALLLGRAVGGREARAAAAGELAILADFAERRGLNRAERRRLKMLTTRWLMLGLIVRGGLARRPLELATFLVGSLGLVPAMLGVGADFLLRRLQARASFA